MRLILFFVTTVSFAATAQAANWAYFAECGDAHHLHVYSYDTASIGTRRGDRVVRINVDYTRDPASVAKSGRMEWSLNCAARTYYENNRTDYRASRTVLAKYNKRSQTMTIIDGSVADKLARQVCA